MFEIRTLDEIVRRLGNDFDLKFYRLKWEVRML